MYNVAILNDGKNMNKVLLLSLIVGLSTSNTLMAGACDASSAEEISALYGVQAQDVKEESTYQRKTTSECMWSFQDSSGHGIAITFRTFDKTAKITNPNFFENNQKYLVNNGNQVGKMKLTYRFANFPNTEHGIVSDVYGNRFTKSLHYVWVKGEERRLGVTLSSTMNEQGDMSEPTVDGLKKAVKIFTD